MRTVQLSEGLLSVTQTHLTGDGHLNPYLVTVELGMLMLCFWLNLLEPLPLYQISVV